MLWYPSIPSVCLGILWFLWVCFGFAYHTPKGLSLCTSLSIALLWYVHTLLAYLSIALHPSLYLGILRPLLVSLGLPRYIWAFWNLLGLFGMPRYLLGLFPLLVCVGLPFLYLCMLRYLWVCFGIISTPPSLHFSLPSDLFGRFGYGLGMDKKRTP